MPQTRDRSDPYATLPPRSRWRSGVIAPDGLLDLYRPTVEITPSSAVATAGSCFAQHIGQRLRQAGLNILDAEPLPPVIPDKIAQRFGYRLFSGRYGNIYTPRQLCQLLGEIIEGRVDPRFVWPRPKGGFVDAFRPTVEPQGIGTVEEVLLHRDYHLEKTAQMLRQADVFVFTLGLTEAWADRATGRVFPVCPGVAGGRFSPDDHGLQRFDHADIMADLGMMRSLLHRFNPAMRLILSVSPVPLVATATDDHVLAANCRAKATLRSAAGEFSARHQDVDYFPSYELVTTPAAGGPFFAPDQRSVTEQGIDRVMEVFFSAHGLDATPRATGPSDDRLNAQLGDDPEGPQCDELLLEIGQ